MQRHRVPRPDGFKPSQTRAAVSEIVLGVHLPPQAAGGAVQGLVVVLGLEAQACGEKGCHGAAFGQLFMASREPMPLGVLMLAQVPAGTNFQALPW